MYNPCRVVTMDVGVASLDQVVNKVGYLVQSNKGAYVCVSNVHMCMETFDSPEFRSVVNNADIVIPDGRPIYWGQKLLGVDSPQQVRGQDIMSALCEASRSSNSVRIGLYGGFSNKVLERVKCKLADSYPGIEISFSYSPPFRQLTPEEDRSVVEAINAAQVDIMFVGIGCPKQEYWMAAHKQQLTCVMLGVGAAFDFIAGRKKHAPRWMQRCGLEWLFRLNEEPFRLGKRYFKQNPRFVFHFCRQWLFGKSY